MKTYFIDNAGNTFFYCNFASDDLEEGDSIVLEVDGFGEISCEVKMSSLTSFNGNISQFIYTDWQGKIQK